MKLIQTEGAQEKMIAGVTALADVVSRTLGPKGTNVVLDRPYGDPVITNDGVTIAKEVEFEDPFQNLGAKLIKQVANAANEAAGDGTTTATVIASALATGSQRHLTSGSNPILLRKGMLAASHVIKDTLEGMSIPVDTEEDFYNVAYISSGGNHEIATMISSAVAQVGAKGVIQTEAAQAMRSSLHVVEGVEFENGYYTPYFINDASKRQAVFENPMIILCDHIVSDFMSLVPFMQTANEEKMKMIFIAEDFEPEVINALIVNNMKAAFKVCAIKAPFFGDKRRDFLQDLAALTGATVFSHENSTGLSEMFSNSEMAPTILEMLGAAETVRVTDKATIITKGACNEELLKQHIEGLQAQLDDEKTQLYDKNWLKERIANLTNSVAVIRVGATTEVEQKELMLRVEDAVNATKAAAESGILPGGGTALYVAREVLLEELKKYSQEAMPDADIRLGIALVYDALMTPVKTIITNAGESSDLILDKVTTKNQGENKNYGYDAYNSEIVDMLEAGIIDPAKVTISAVSNAISIVATLISSSGAIVYIPEER